VKHRARTSLLRRIVMWAAGVVLVVCVAGWVVSLANVHYGHSSGMGIGFGKGELCVHNIHAYLELPAGWSTSESPVGTPRSWPPPAAPRAYPALRPCHASTGTSCTSTASTSPHPGQPGRPWALWPGALSPRGAYATATRPLPPRARHPRELRGSGRCGC